MQKVVSNTRRLDMGADLRGFGLNLSQDVASPSIHRQGENFSGRLSLYRPAVWSTDGEQHACKIDKTYTKCLTPRI
jgi:hypothetical protein